MTILRTLAAFFALTTSVALALGCSNGTGISLTRSELTLHVGDVRDVLPYVVFAPSTTDRTVSVTADGACVTVDGTTLTAVDEGSASITVECGGTRAAITVSVTYRAPTEFTIEYSGALVQTVAADETAQPIVFSARCDTGATLEQTAWTVNGAAAATGGRFEFEPESYGVFEVVAECDGLSAAQTVTVYRDSEAVGCFDGPLDLRGSRAPIVFTVRESIDTRNPRSTYEWRVNGKTASAAAVFEFVPSAAGEFEISLTVNGKPREFEDGKPTVKVTADRSAPTAEVVFDNTEGKVYIKWTGEARSVSLTSPDGVRRVFERSDIRHAYLFDGNSFDATEYINVCSDRPAEYRITLTGDVRGEQTVFEQYPTQARAYLTRKLFTENTFVSDITDAREFAEDMYLTGKSNVDCYIGHGVSAVAARNAIVDTAARLGATATVTIYDCIAHVEMSGLVNAPTSDGAKIQVEQIETVIPHIEYTHSALRRADHVFPSDRAAVEARVETSEQLLYCLTRGYRPAPVNGSAAGEIYRRACSVLRNIIGADYSDADKVHAIHDWLQWSTRRVYTAESGSAYSYLEGVFGSVGVEPCSAYTSSGAAKAFAVLCRIEGIRCDIATQTSGGGTYCFNRVELDGRYYNVDVFGGENLTGSTTRREILSHARLLISDAQAETFGLVPSGEAATDDGMTYHLKKSVYDGYYTDSYIARTELDEKDVQAAVFSALDGMNGVYGGYIIPGVGTTKTVMRTSFYAEFALDGTLTDAQAYEVAQEIGGAAAEYLEKHYGVKPSDARINVILTERIVQMTVPVSFAA